MKMLLLTLFTLTLLLPALSAFAKWGDSGCMSQIYGRGLWKNYTYLPKNAFATTSNMETCKWSTEISTASTDPKIWVQYSTGVTESVSSFGNCRLFGDAATEARTQYIAQNMVELKKQIAMGQGGHLDSIAFFSFCEPTSKDIFSSELQKNMSEFVDLTEQSADEFAKRIDSIVQKNWALKNSCQLHS